MADERHGAVAAQARRDLEAATAQRPLPAPLRSTRSSSAARRRISLRSPASLSLAAASLVLGVLLGTFVIGHRVAPGPTGLTSVTAGSQPAAVATDGALIWVADRGSGQVRAFDAHTLAQRWIVSGGDRPVALAYGLNALWVVDAGENRLRKLSPADGRTLGATNTSLDPVAVTTAGGLVWVLSAGNRSLDGYDPQSLLQTRAALTQQVGVGVSVNQSTIWVATQDRLLRISPTGQIDGEFQMGTQILLVAATSRYIWVATADSRLFAVDPLTGAILGRSALAAGPTALAADARGATVACQEGTISRVAAAGAAASTVARTGTELTGIALTPHTLTGTSPSTGLLYLLKE